ncbi:MAG: glutamate-5-semialdehyde dehydrogenase [Verrucomicrobiae bacterium]|nr:glutamate-5-semialdehyde dehydrogenase [Verrucomicrobiae bacterium]
MTTTEIIHDMGRRARKASRLITRLNTAEKNAVLSGMASALESHAPAILAANRRDMEAGQDSGLSAAMLDRLLLNEKRIADMVRAIRELVGFNDPVGRILDTKVRPNGLTIEKTSVPIGVIGIIYESRPNVTADAASLCFKAGNACILRGGKEAIHSNLAIATALMEGGRSAGLPEDSIQVVPITDREAIKIMAQMDQYLDMIVPRGGYALIEAVVQNARVPVIKHAHGICHVYVDAGADLAMAEKITVNAKCQRPGVCNALETLLVHEAVAAEFLPHLAQTLAGQKVEVRGDAATQKLIPGCVPATEQDWSTEYLDLILSIRVVENIDAALDHIAEYGSHHTDSIITPHEDHAKRFLREVDSAVVLVNASTRFNDGGELGLGAEIGISTDKLHARGPMGLEELTTFKYIVRGTGQVRA